MHASREGATLESMIAPLRRRHSYSYADYLELDERSNVKLEFLDGEIFAMAGGTPQHAALAMNVGIALGAVLERDCLVYSSDLRIRVMSTGLAAYPDVTVVCGPAQTDPDSRTTVINPATSLDGERPAARGPISSVTLIVTQEQALQLARARWNGELDVALLAPEATAKS